MLSRTTRACLILLLAALVPSAIAAEVKFTPPQQEAVNKLNAKGISVMQLASDTDALVVNASLAGKTATDAEVALVKDLPKVAQRNLATTAVTDAGLASIAGLTDLTMLHLDRTAVTDAGLVHLKGLSNLVYLNLYNTPVTDAGLAHLAGLKNLKRLYLWQTKVTDAGVNPLKASVAGLTVNRGEELTIVPPKVDEKKPEAKPVAAAGKAINEKCPVTDTPPAAQSTAVHEGRTVAFCCNNCPETFKKEPAKFLAKLPKAEEKKPEPKKEEPKPVAAKPVNDKCPVSGKAIDAAFTTKHDNKLVAFCCGMCEEAFKKEPAKSAAKIVEVNTDAKPEEKKEEKKEDKKEDKKPAAAAAKPVNAVCPVSGKAVDAAFTAVHETKTVAFCCDKC